jgi:hypothetical protein
MPNSTSTHGKIFPVKPLIIAIFSFSLRFSQSKPRCHWKTASNRGSIYRNLNKPQLTAVCHTADTTYRGMLKQDHVTSTAEKVGFRRARHVSNELRYFKSPFITVLYFMKTFL